MSIKDRLSRLEGRNGPACPECRMRPEVIHVFYPEEGDPAPELRSCPKCDRTLGIVIRVECEGEGGIGYGTL